ncbi:unnamed protein product [Ceratitis capitata]|uniref:(Mediterranean fruit fly) hypothetical protein n=1 Tax=Ceratitis capitata TaxID=7213 RepID=A0A811UXX2_CERCA|nr:unnamed protein product [Ceratitis capitata]
MLPLRMGHLACYAQSEHLQEIFQLVRYRLLRSERTPSRNIPIGLVGLFFSGIRSHLWVPVGHGFNLIRLSTGLRPQESMLFPQPKLWGAPTWMGITKVTDLMIDPRRVMTFWREPFASLFTAALNGGSESRVAATARLMCKRATYVSDWHRYREGGKNILRLHQKDQFRFWNVTKIKLLQQSYIEFPCRALLSSNKCWNVKNRVNNSATPT